MDIREAFRELWEQMKFLGTVDVRVYIGIAAGVGALIFGFYLAKKRAEHQKRRLDRARAAGNRIEARKIGSTIAAKDKGFDYREKYVYMVDEKEKYYYVTTDSRAPQVISLYYDKDPRRVYSAYQGDAVGFLLLCPYFLFVPMGVLWLVATLLGYRW